MLRILLLLSLILIFAYVYGPVLFSEAPVLKRVKRLSLPAAVLAFLALAVVNGFRGEPEEAGPRSAETETPVVETTAAIPQPVVPEPLTPRDAATACVERALSEARAAEDVVAETWLSSVEGFLETAPGEVTVQFAVGPRSGPSKDRQCRSEARLTCAVSGRDVRPVTPLHMTGAQIAC